MAWWKKLKLEMLRSQGLEYYGEGLEKIGVQAYPAPRGIPEETYARGLSAQFGAGESVGVIALHGVPTPFVNIRLRSGANGAGHYLADYLLPDDRLSPKLAKLAVSGAIERNFPLFGKPKAVYWKGNDASTGLIDRLNNDMGLKQRLLHTLGDFSPSKIIAMSQHGFWVIRAPANGQPSREIFDIYQSIARHLMLLDKF
jgi:hypothetical protein